MVDAVFALLVMAGVGSIIGAHFRNRPVGGFVLGLILGPIGWLLVIAGPDERKKCHACKGAVPGDARRCRHCGWEQPDGRPVYLPAARMKERPPAEARS